MAYFLKQSKIKGRTYLAIYESFYNPEKKETAHRTLKSLGSVETLIKEGMKDPITYFQREVDKLNSERASKQIKKISDKSPVRYLGYFILKALMDKLEIRKNVSAFNLVNNFKYDLFELLSALVYSRAVEPCSKLRTYNEVIPSLFEKHDFSYDQLMNCVSFLGENYEKFVEIFTYMTNRNYKIETEKTYFDCTNFYFEIDREDSFRKKGPSKEKRNAPIMGLGLLLDKNQIPIGMKMFPGNESEKPVLRDVIKGLKNRNNIKGRTVHVADKGLNCAQNIAFSKGDGNGYLFSKSVKGLPEQERKWVSISEGYKDVKNSKGKTLYRYKSCIDKFPYTFEHDGRKVTVKMTEKRLVTYNPSLAAKQKYEINRMVEKAKLLKLSKAKKSEFGESAKYVIFKGKDGEKACVGLNTKAIKKDLACAGYNMLVTSETEMSEKDMYDTYHQLWRIEESFKIMKSDLDARPAFERTEYSIKGHFLVCYITVLLERLFQFKILKSEFSTNEIFRFLKGLKVIKAENKYINATRDSDLIKTLAEKYKLPLDNYYLTQTQINSILKFKL